MLDAKELKRAKPDDPIPFRITADLLSYKKAGEKTKIDRLSGSAKFYVLDPDGNLLVDKSAPLDKLCPS